MSVNRLEPNSQPYLWYWFFSAFRRCACRSRDTLRHASHKKHNFEKLIPNKKTPDFVIFEPWSWTRAVPSGRSAQYRSNRKKYRIDRIENHQNLQTAEKSRGWLGFWRFFDGIDRLAVIYFSKILRATEKLSNRSNRSTRSSDRAIDRIDRRPPCFWKLPADARPWTILYAEVPKEAPRFAYDFLDSQSLTLASDY